MRWLLGLALALAALVAASSGGVGATLGCSSAPSLDPGTCASCHQAISDRHAISAHAKADESPVFRALVARAAPSVRPFCDRCHSPRADRGERGVGCLACHGVVGNQGTSNGRFLVDDALVQGPTGPTGAGRSAHGTRREPFVTSAELCGTCHEVDGGGGFLETPYAEWAASTAHRDGIACAKCHMAKVPGDPTSGFARGSIAEGVPERDIGDHAFPGIEAGLFDGAAKLTAECVDGAPVVTVENARAGHSLPTGARFARRLTLVGSDGTTHELGDRLLLHGSETIDVLGADAREVRAIPSGDARAFSFPASATRVELVDRRFDERILRDLGLASALAQPRVVSAIDVPSCR